MNLGKLLTELQEAREDRDVAFFELEAIRESIVKLKLLEKLAQRKAEIADSKLEDAIAAAANEGIRSSSVH